VSPGVYQPDKTSGIEKVMAVGANFVVERFFHGDLSYLVIIDCLNSGQIR